MAKSLKINFLYNTILQISRVIFPLITAPYVARVLEPDGVGLFNFSLTYANYFALVAALGIPLYGIRETAALRDNKKEQSRLFSEIFSLSLFTTGITTLFFLLSIIFIPQLKADYLIFLVSAVVLYTSPFKIEWFYQGLEEFGNITYRSLVTKFLSVIALFVFVKEKDDLIIYVAINALSAIVNEVWNFIKIKNYGIHVHLTMKFQRHIKPLLLLFLSAIAMSIYALLDTMMLGFLSDYSEVGYYNSATHISKVLIPIVTSLAAVTMPRLSYYARQGDIAVVNGLIDKSVSVIAFLSLPITIGIFVIGPVFVPLFYGNLFYGAILPLQIVVFIIVAIGFSNLFGVQVLLSMKKDKLFLYSVIAGTVINFTLNAILIPLFAATGAAIASVVAECSVTSMMLLMILKYTPIKICAYWDLIKCFIGIIPFFFMMPILKLWVSGWMLVALMVIVCSLIYFAIEYILRNSAMEMVLETARSKMKKQHNG